MAGGRPGSTPAQVARIAIWLCHFQNHGLGDEVVDSPSLRVREHYWPNRSESSRWSESQRVGKSASKLTEKLTFSGKRHLHAWVVPGEGSGPNVCPSDLSG